VDLNVIADAPRHLNISGFGDMTGILISSVDWLISNMMGMAEGYSEMAADIMQDSSDALLQIDRQVGAMSSEGLKVLAKILVMAGIISSMGYGTAPVSGFEHMISHALDLEGLATGRKLSLHGAQVGLATAYASVAYNQFIKEFSPEKIDMNICYPSPKEALDDVSSRFGHLDLDGKSVDEIWTHYSKKLSLWKQNRPIFEEFLKNWNNKGGPKHQISTNLASAEKIIKALYFSGNPILPEELTPPISTEQMKFDFLNARFMRNRFVMADIIGWVGIINDGFWAKVDSEVRRISSTLRS
jgi:glycerol-1-phosphate dehydrogenase [NAD(P)+]